MIGCGGAKDERLAGLGRKKKRSVITAPERKVITGLMICLKIQNMEPEDSDVEI